MVFVGDLAQVGFFSEGNRIADFGGQLSFISGRFRPGADLP